MTDLAVASQAASTFAQVRQAIDACTSPEDANEAFARVAAARAWAKAHGQIRDFRLQLLDLEVAALVQVIELGGAHLLSAADRKAGEYLAALGPDERRSLIESSRSATTAAGLVRSILAEEEARATASRVRSAGAAWARGERGAAAIIAEEVAYAGRLGRTFDVAQIAESVADEVDLGSDDFMEGVKEMCRTYMRKLPSDEIDGTIIPKFITSQLPDGSWVRVPTYAATVGDLYASLRMRDAQLEQDRASRERFAEFVAKISALSSDETSMVGDLLAASVATA